MILMYSKAALKEIIAVEDSRSEQNKNISEVLSKQYCYNILLSITARLKEGLRLHKQFIDIDINKDSTYPNEIITSVIASLHNAGWWVTNDDGYITIYLDDIDTQFSFF